jgi:hypothetical protein
MLLMYDIHSYNKWHARTGRYTVYAADMDSIYLAWRDTMTANGIRTSPGIIPPGDQYEGYIGTQIPRAYPRGYLGDTILAFCRRHNMPMRTYRNNTGSYPLYLYGSMMKKDGVKLIFEKYMLAQDSIKLTTATRMTNVANDFGAIYGLRTTYGYDNLNQGRYAEFRQPGPPPGAGRYLYCEEMSGPATPCITVHVGNLFTRRGFHCAQYTATEQLLKHLAFFDELAGRQIYKPVFLDGFDWNLLMRTN